MYDIYIDASNNPPMYTHVGSYVTLRVHPPCDKNFTKMTLLGVIWIPHMY